MCKVKKSLVSVLKKLIIISLLFFNRNVKAQSDQCDLAPAFTIGNCNTTFNIPESFTNNQMTPISCFAGAYRDGWATFTPTVTGFVTIQYTNTTKNAALIVYSSGVGGSGANCTDSEFEESDCTNIYAGLGTESITTSVASGETYYVRIVDVGASGADGDMNGTLCIYEGLKKNTDICSTALDLSVGICNAEFNVLTENINDEARTTTSCPATTNQQDAWIRFTTPDLANFVSDLIAIEYLNSTENAAIEIYSGDCGTLTLIGCENDIAGIGLERRELTVMPSTTYFLRIVNVGAATDMLGNICIYNVYTRDICTSLGFGTVPILDVGVSSCNVKAHILGTTFDNGSAAGCDFPTGNRDAWFIFRGNGMDVVVEYQSTNNKEVNMAIYTGLSAPGVCDPSDANIVINPATGCLVGSGGGSTVEIIGNPLIFPFSTFPTISGQLYYVRIGNESDTDEMEGTICIYNQNAFPGISCASPLDLGPLGAEDCGIQFNFDNVNYSNIEEPASLCIPVAPPYVHAWAIIEINDGQTFTVQYDNDNNDASSVADVALAVYTFPSGVCPSGLVEQGCVNALVEGVESLTLTDPIGGGATTIYYIRVVNLEPFTYSTVNGRLCVFSGASVRADICEDPLAMVVEDCDVDFNITTQFIYNAAVPDPPCGGGFRDGWASFTANANRTTIEYATEMSDNTVMAIYRGSCTSPVYITCTASPAVGIKVIDLPTVPGVRYLIRIINTTSNGTVSGKLCINNTLGSDFCDPDALVTVPMGTCSARFDVPDSFDPSPPGPVLPIAGPCMTTKTALRDAWTRIIGTGGDITIQYENGEASSDPIIHVYTRNPGGPITCSSSSVGDGVGNPANLLACADDFGPGFQTESLTLTATNVGQQYLVRIIDATDVAGMRGRICVFRSDNDLDVENDACLDPLSMDIGDCGVQLNVLPGAVIDGSDPLTGCGAASVTGLGDAWATFTTGSNLADLQQRGITIQYNNINFNSSTPEDVILVLYKGTSGATAQTFEGVPCGSTAETITTPGTCPFAGLNEIACMDSLTLTGREGIEQIYFVACTETTYYIRIINKSATGKTAFGKLCVFFGPERSDPLCLPSVSNIVTDGRFVGFDIPSSFGRDPNASSDIGNCVFTTSGSTQPATQGPPAGPIVKDAWAQFTVPFSVPAWEAVTIQYDNNNGNGVVDDVGNTAIAVYTACPVGGSDADLEDCANFIWEGTESLTIAIIPGNTYYIRVMNASTSSNTISGRLRVFKYVDCDILAEQTLVRDPSFVEWRDFTNYANMPSGDNDPTRGNPDLANWTRFARFATDYGYVQNFRTNTSNADNITSSADFVAPTGFSNAELDSPDKEGLFGVSKNGRDYHQNFFSYGSGFPGYGGNNAAYCNTGGAGFGQDACLGYPALIPTDAVANFMVVNGWYKNPTLGDNSPGKVWCQTIENITPGSFYVVTAYFNNLIRSGNNLDVPQLAMTICDMQDPAETGTNCIADAYPADPFRFLPGTTTFNLNGTPSNLTDDITVHDPIEPQGVDLPRLGENARIREASYGPFGAAMPCNLSGEPKNYRLKTLSAEIFLPERPDQWLVARCIYQAPIPDGSCPPPISISQLNFCLENNSLTQNGNDLAVDDINFYECSNLTPEDRQVLERLLEGGSTCELGDDPNLLGVPQSVTLLDFNGKLLGNQVLLNWLTMSETNSKRFEVQRSENGKDFKKIGEVQASGNSNTLNNYNFTDAELPVGRRVLYYRLRIVDGDDNSKLSMVIRVELEALNTFDMKLIPNPNKAGEEVEVRFNVSEGRAEVSVIDLMGVKMMSQRINTVNGNNSLFIKTTGFKTGIYLVRVVHNGMNVVKRLLVL